MNNPYGADQERLKEIAQILLQCKGNMRSTENAAAALIPLVEDEGTLKELEAVKLSCKVNADRLQNLYDNIAREAFHEKESTDEAK